MATRTDFAALAARHAATRTIGPAQLLTLTKAETGSTLTTALAVGRRYRVAWTTVATESTSSFAMVAVGDEEADSGTATNKVLLTAEEPSFELVIQAGSTYVAAHDEAGGSILLVTEISA